MGVSISDLIALAKAGYTPGQVKELIALSEKEPETKHEEQPGATAPHIEDKAASPEPLGATEKEVQPQEPEKVEINYKELYEKSQEDLKKAQEANRKTDASINQQADPTKHLLDIFASY